MQLRKLQLEGKGKKNAVIEFTGGLNVIAGASDTGKTFAYECINYALGATEIPTVPNEAVGYQYVLLEFLNKSSKQIITLKRSLLESEKNDIYYIYSGILDIEDTKNYEKLSSVSTAKNSLSSKLLSICNCAYRNVLKSTKKGQTEAFTFRKIVYLVMLNETRIVQKNSPIFMADTGREKNSTKETASFFTMLSGLDYQKYQKPENPEIKKAHLKGAIDELNLICAALQQEITDKEKIVGNNEVKKVQETIEDIEYALMRQRETVENLERERLEKVSRLTSFIREKNRLQDNLSKFNLLKKNYLSDVNRLEFIEQTYDYTGQLMNVKCPICHAEMKTQMQDNKLYYAAISREKKKLNAHLIDLQNTIDDFGTDLLDITHSIEIEKKDIGDFERQLDKQSSEISKTLIAYEEQVEIRNELNLLENSKRNLADTKRRIQKLNDQIDNIKSISQKVNIKRASDEQIKEFCSIIQELLENWSFIKRSKSQIVEFNTRSKDVVVASKEKASYGKGARAIINTSFVIALMEYCEKQGLSHPGFVVLDSPLTTFKERDRDKQEENENIDDGIKAQFFRNLAQIDKDKQIIVFDNEIPPTDLTGITYQHFSGNVEIDRAGFIV